MSNADSNAWWKQLLAVAIVLLCLVAAWQTRSWSTTQSGPPVPSEDDRTNKKVKKPPLPDFLIRAPVLLPGLFGKRAESLANKPNDLDQEEIDRRIAESNLTALKTNRAKPGHWYSTHFPVISNHFNIEGELEAYSVSADNKPIPIPRTNYVLKTKRPAALAKSEWKNLATSVFVPTRQANISTVNINLSLNRPNASLAQVATVQPVLAMQPFQHHFVVLSDRPDSWSFLRLTDSFQLRGTLGSGELQPPFYYLIPSIPGDPLPLPRNPLQWTTIAYVLWDNLSPSSLDPDQQHALLDWLHHGGQLIVSGPDCLDQLQTSFLSEWLPAHFDGTIDLTADSVKELNEHWSVPNLKRSSETRSLVIPKTAPLLGVRFLPHEKAKFVNNTGQIAIERQVGRGRIVVTAFSLRSPIIRNWRSMPSFLNGALLRKPAREFFKNQNLVDTYRWANDSTSIDDPLLGSTVRFISRDLSELGTNKSARSKTTTDDRIDDYSGSANEARSLSDDWHYGGFQESRQSGVGGWNDFTGVAKAARRSLKDDAGIKPPSADFVLKMLAGYLAVLVPLNWLVFRLLGRVEYAWLAAPLIAIGGAVCVVKMASLDIGFVRSNTELGVLEVFADHPRAHLTQYSALYTSLSTRYTADLDNATSQALPFATRESVDRKQQQQTLETVNLNRTARNRLENYHVQSNSTAMLHIESMLDLEGTFSIDRETDPDQPWLNNDSAIDLSEVGVIQRSADTQTLSLAWIGDLKAGQTHQLNFKTTTADALYQRWYNSTNLASSTHSATEIWQQNVQHKSSEAGPDEILSFPQIQPQLDEYRRVIAQMSVSMESERWKFSDFRAAYQAVNPVDSEASVSVGNLFDVVARNLQLGPGETRLIAVTNQALGRTKLEPEATQTRRQTLVVVHLQQPTLPPARRDENAIPDRSNQSNLDFEEEMEELEMKLEPTP